MATTKVSDVIVPAVFSDYVIEKVQEKSALFRSGIAVPNARLNELITGGGKVITIPAFKDLTGNSEVLSDETALTPAKIGTKADVAHVLYRGKAWSSNELAGALAGASPIEAIATLVADFWVRDEQATLINILTGVFAASSMSGLVAGSSSDYYNGDLIIDAQGKLGDAAGKLQCLVMHSAVRNDLFKKDKTAFTTYRDGNIEYNRYLGYEVIVDDTCPYDSTTGVYTSYLFAKGSVSLGDGQPVDLTITETDRDSLAGNDVLINRKALVIHPNGMKFKGTPAGQTPSNSELATGTNWERVSEVKNMGIVKVDAKIGTAPVEVPQTQTTETTTETTTTPTSTTPVSDNPQ